MDRKAEAMVVIMPDHGTLVAAENHNKAFVLFNALEANSKYIYDKEVLRTGMIVGSVFEKIGSNTIGSLQKKIYKNLLVDHNSINSQK